MTQNAGTFSPIPWIARDNRVKDAYGFEVCFQSPNPEYKQTAQEERNFQLIAAAPELLEALEEVCEQPPSGWSIADGMKVLAKCQYAIAKAKGQEP